MYQPDKDGRTLRHLSGVEWARVQRGQNNAWYTQRASTAVIAKNKKKKDKKKKKKPTIQFPDIQRTESSTERIPLYEERQKVDYRVMLRGNDKVYQEIRYEWERAAGLTLPALSIHTLSEATKFQRKSWIHQVEIATHFATNRSRRLFKGTG